jgi:lipopolysaccharide biosynthesis regulator YciM
MSFFFKLFNLRKSSKVHTDYSNIKDNNTNAERNAFYEISTNKNQNLFRAYDCILNKDYTNAIKILSELNEKKNNKLLSEKYYLLACCYSNLDNKELVIENLTYYCYYLEYVSVSRIILDRELEAYKNVDEFKSLVRLVCKNSDYKSSFKKLSEKDINYINEYLSKII